MKRIPKISETEWEVMQVVWAKSPLSSGEIIDALQASDPTWHPKTAKTLLNRLVKKKALGYEKEGRAYLYRPLVKEADCALAESESFLDRVFGGAVKPLLVHFIERQKLNARDVEELKEVLKRKQK